tara:strand:+ start:112 stop:423 length:312 start_codon:yes stop_codon:yes gene_type:complete
MSKKLNKFIDEAIENIRRDRETTQELLSDLIKIAAQSEMNHKEVSMSAAKYLETLQRSNEQLVKIAALVQRDEKVDTGFDFTGTDKDNIYDMIKKKDKGGTNE